MKDFLENDLNIGDVVVTTPKNYRGLVKATILSFTPKKVHVSYMNTWNYGLPGRPETYLVDQIAVVKIQN
jgi:hypothetical protein